MTRSEYCPFCSDSPISFISCRGLNAKLMDEAKALELCRSKVKQRKLPMEVIDAEYQWCVILETHLRITLTSFLGQGPT